MVNQGFFSFRDNFGEQMSDKFAGEGEKVAKVDGASQPVRIDTVTTGDGRTFKRVLPDFGAGRIGEIRLKKAEADFVSPRGNEFGQIASSDLTNLRVGSPEVRLASVKSYIPDVTRPYAPDDVGDYIKDSETEKRPTYGENLEKAMDKLDSFDIKRINKATEEYGVPMSKEERRATTAYTITNPDVFGGYYRFPDTNYDKIQSDYDKYQPLRDRRLFRKGVEDNLSDFRSDYMKDFRDADYAIKMKQYNLDGTEKDINRYNQTLDQQIDNLDRLSVPNYSLDRFGNVLPRSEVEAYNKKVDSEEAERIRLSKLQARKNYEDSQKTILQRVENFLGAAFNTITGTQEARGDVLDGRINFNNSVPNISTFSETGDPSFRSYRMGEDFSNLIRGVGDLPAQDTSFSSYVRGAQPGQERGNTRLQEARNIARRNPNVSINEKTGRAEATNNSGRARAQAMAVNRKLSGKSISQKKAENKQAMKDRAKARHAAFKKKRAEKKKNKKKK